jgi:uncharacterized protein (DUF169 family)
MESKAIAAEKLDVEGICRALDGKIRGNPVAVTLFTGEIPPDYSAHKVDPCAVLRLARDGDEPVMVDRTTHDCTHGQFLMGFGEGSEVIKTARLLPLYISAYSQQGSTAVNSGDYTFPQGALTGIGAAPLDRVPAGVAVDSIVLVCTPFWASSLGAVRTVEDGTPPSAAAGSSFCSDAFATTYYTENVILAPGDVGGRMNNKLRPEEMFVVIPARWANNIVRVLEATIDVRGLYEATRRDDSEYWDRKQRREERAEEFKRSFAADEARKRGLTISMEWEVEALDQVASSPKFVRKFAVGNVEDYARDHDIDLVTLDVIKAQMSDAGVAKFMKFLKR